LTSIEVLSIVLLLPLDAPAPKHLLTSQPELEGRRWILRELHQRMVTVIAMAAMTMSCS